MGNSGDAEHDAVAPALRDPPAGPVGRAAVRVRDRVAGPARGRARRAPRRPTTPRPRGRSAAVPTTRRRRRRRRRPPTIRARRCPAPTSRRRPGSTSRSSSRPRTASTPWRPSRPSARRPTPRRPVPSRVPAVRSRRWRRRRRPAARSRRARGGRGTPPGTRGRRGSARRPRRRFGSPDATVPLIRALSATTRPPARSRGTISSKYVAYSPLAASMKARSQPSSSSASPPARPAGAGRRVRRPRRGRGSPARRRGARASISKLDELAVRRQRPGQVERRDADRGADLDDPASHRRRAPARAAARRSPAARSARRRGRRAPPSRRAARPAASGGRRGSPRRRDRGSACAAPCHRPGRAPRYPVRRAPRRRHRGPRRLGRARLPGRAGAAGRDPRPRLLLGRGLDAVRAPCARGSRRRCRSRSSCWRRRSGRRRHGQGALPHARRLPAGDRADADRRPAHGLRLVAVRLRARLHVLRDRRDGPGPRPDARRDRRAAPVGGAARAGRRDAHRQRRADGHGRAAAERTTRCSAFCHLANDPQGFGLGARRSRSPRPAGCRASTGWRPSRCRSSSRSPCTRRTTRCATQLMPVNRRYPLDGADGGLPPLPRGDAAPDLRRVPDARRRQRRAGAWPTSSPTCCTRRRRAASTST